MKKKIFLCVVMFFCLIAFGLKIQANESVSTLIAGKPYLNGDDVNQKEFVCWVYYEGAKEEELKYLDLNDDWRAQWFLEYISPDEYHLVDDYEKKISESVVIDMSPDYMSKFCINNLPRYGFMRYIFDISLSHRRNFGRLVAIGDKLQPEEIDIENSITPEIWLDAASYSSFDLRFCYVEYFEKNDGVLVKVYTSISNDWTGGINFLRPSFRDKFDWRMERMSTVQKYSTGGVFVPLNYILPEVRYVNTAEKEYEEFMKIYGDLPYIKSRIDPEKYLEEYSIIKNNQIFTSILKSCEDDINVIFLSKEKKIISLSLPLGDIVYIKQDVICSNTDTTVGGYIGKTKISENLFSLDDYNYYWVHSGEYKEHYKNNRWWIEKTGDQPLIIEVFDY